MNTEQKAFFNPPVPQDHCGLPPGAALWAGQLRIVGLMLSPGRTAMTTDDDGLPAAALA